MVDKKEYPFIEVELRIMEKAAEAKASALMREFMDFQKASSDAWVNEALGEALEMAYPTPLMKISESVSVSPLEDVLHHELDYVTSVLRNSLQTGKA